MRRHFMVASRLTGYTRSKLVARVHISCKQPPHCLCSIPISAPLTSIIGKKASQHMHMWQGPFIIKHLFPTASNNKNSPQQQLHVFCTTFPTSTSIPVNTSTSCPKHPQKNHRPQGLCIRKHTAPIGFIIKIVKGRWVPKQILNMQSVCSAARYSRTPLASIISYLLLVSYPMRTSSSSICWRINNPDVGIRNSIPGGHGWRIVVVVTTASAILLIQPVMLRDTSC